MTRVIIKQPTGCTNAFLYICHRFFYLSPCSQPFSFAVSWYVRYVCMCCDSDALHCTAQQHRYPCITMGAPSTGHTQNQEARSTPGKWGTAMTSSSSGHTADSNPLSELLQKTTYYNTRGVMTTNSQRTMLALIYNYSLQLDCSLNR